MPKGPNGQRRPADVISCAVMVAKIATGEIENDLATNGRRRSGIMGGAACAAKMPPEARTAVARKGAEARWKKEA